MSAPAPFMVERFHDGKGTFWAYGSDNKMYMWNEYDIEWQLYSRDINEELNQVLGYPGKPL